LTYGVAMLASYLLLTAVLRTTAELTGMIGLHVILELLVVLLATGLTAVAYDQRFASYRSRRLAENSFDGLKAVQARLLVSRNALSQTRLAAALAHDLATPIGSFASALDTVRLAMEKLLPPELLGDRLMTAASDAFRTAERSRDRLQETLARMKSLTNLDGASERLTDVNQIWRETALLLHFEIGSRAEVLFDLKPVPATLCRPEQISAVFANLIRNAAAALEARGTIEIRTSHSSGAVLSEVRDTGRGMTAEALEQLFEPAFRVEGGRVTTSNWGLFVSRGILADHGGGIEVESEPRRGTTVRISLPVR
jgi:two-component system, NtrC family, sensor kinase